MRNCYPGNPHWRGEVECLQCHQTVPRKAHQQKFCSHACWKRYQYLHASTAHKHYEKSQHKQGLAAPALAQSRAQLEALCNVQNREEWPQIIARFRAPPTPGYPTLTKLTQDCVAAKLRLMV